MEGKIERKSVVRRKMVVAATIGVVVGGFAGVLLAPKSGKETRKDIVNNIKEMTKKVKEVAKKDLDKLEVMEEEIKAETHKIVSEVKETVSVIEDAANDSPHFESFKKKLK
jgi:gas vesicle protein